MIRTDCAAFRQTVPAATADAAGQVRADCDVFYPTWQSTTSIGATHRMGVETSCGMIQAALTEKTRYNEYAGTI